METCAQGCVLYQTENRIVRLNPNSISSPLSRAMLLEQLERLNAQNFRLNESAIDAAVQYSQGNLPPSEPLFSESALIIAEPVDAAVSVDITDDAMVAILTVEAPLGGRPLSACQLLSALKARGVVKGISKKQLQQLFVDSKSLTAGERVSLPVAYGKPAVDGLNSSFERLVADVATRVLQPRAKEDGSVDMRDLGNEMTVKANQPLMLRMEASAGSDGFTVTGALLAAKAGRVLPFAVGNGTMVSDVDPNLLVASQPGMPIFSDSGCRVDPLLVLDGVNVATGHIEFDGSVLVNGDVAAGMRLVASGTVTVTGFVELAELRAGADILVQNGIVGRQHELDNLDCTVCAGGSVASRFAQYANINAGKNATFTLHALHCHITVGQDLEVMDVLKRQGTLSGGIINAGRSIRAVSVGAVAGVPTSLHSFLNGARMRGGLARLSAALQQENDNADKTRALELKLSKQADSRQLLEVGTHIRRAMDSHRHRIDELRCEYDLALEEYQRMRRMAEVRIYQHLFQRVSVRIDEQQKMIAEEQAAVSIRLGEKALDLQVV